MTSAVHPDTTFDQTRLPLVLRRAVVLGAIEAACVLFFSLASRFLAGGPETAVRALIVLAGLTAVTLLPGTWIRPRTIEGIAGAAGLGLAAAVVFLIIDVIALQPTGTYTNRWLEIGGGSNWWYHPVWWMAGTFLPWMGAFCMANQRARSGEASPPAVMGLSLGLAIVLGLGATLIGFPGASIGLGTFAVAFLPALALAALITGGGGRRGPRG